jgi:hypothetical protein
MDIERYGNLIESVWWFAASSVFAFKTIKARGSMRLAFAVLSISFLVFGITDLIESETGGWWTVPFCFEDYAKLVQSPPVLGSALSWPATVIEVFLDGKS